MATCRDIIIRALRRIAVIDASEEPTGVEAVNALQALQEELDRLQAGTLLQPPGDDVDGNYIAPPAGVLNLNSTFPMARQHEWGFVATLAIRLAPEYQVEVSRETLDAANRWRRNLAGAFDQVRPPLKVDWF